MVMKRMEVVGLTKAIVLPNDANDYDNKNTGYVHYIMTADAPVVLSFQL